MATQHRKNIVGANVQKTRSLHAWTQEKLATRCQLLGWQITRETLAKIEAGARRVNDAEVALLAHALQMPPEALLSTRPPLLLRTARHSAAG